MLDPDISWVYIKYRYLRTSVADPWHFGVDPDPDPRLCLMDPDPDPAIFVSDLQDASKKLIF